MELAILLACMAVIVLVVLTYEGRLKKLEKQNEITLGHNKSIMNHGYKLITNYNILLSILREHFEEEEIEKMFEEKKGEY